MNAMMKYADTPNPEQCPPGDKNRVMHAHLIVDGRNLLASDTPEGQFKPMQGFSLSLYCDSPDEAKAKFDMLADGGNVVMPFGPTFWAKGFGMLTDRFGTLWLFCG